MLRQSFNKTSSCFRPEKALKDAEAALRLDRVFYQATIVSAKAHCALGNHGQARQSLEEYLALGPDNDDVYLLWKSLEDKVNLIPLFLVSISRFESLKVPQQHDMLTLD